MSSNSNAKMSYFNFFNNTSNEGGAIYLENEKNLTL